MEENESIRIDEGKRKIVGYQVRATELFKNGEELAMKGELEKAGEFFWGAISCYLNALEFLDKGKAHGGHGEMVKMA
ncbi:MAG: hypothetical protein HYU03_08415 [Thaumarchaeota archaeon]|nr:hypothetical protein [Nitrososphaerota archaeon]